jgi:DNA-binding beta-propeller fold protein YncE
MDVGGWRRSRKGAAAAGLARKCAVAAVALVSAWAGVGVSAARATGATAPTFLRSLGGPGGHATIYPSGLDVDASGNLYVADTGNDQIVAFSPTGSQLWRVGSETDSKALGNFSQPRDLAFLNGKLYVADEGNNRIQVLNASNGSAVTQFPTRFNSVIGVSAGVTGSGKSIILAAEDLNNTIGIFKTTGSPVANLGSGPGNGNGQLNAPRDAATDSKGDIFVADYNNDRIAEFSPSRAWLRNWGSRGTGPGQFNRPYGVAVDSAGNVYVADSGSNNRIQVFTNTGAFIRYYGANANGVGIFTGLRRVAVAPGANPQVYGADLWGYRVVRFSSGGAQTLIYGGTPPATGAFNHPYGLASDTTNTYVVDTNNQRIQAFDPSAGGYQFSWGVRGFGADNLGFNWPRDVTIASTTNTVWVADTKNFRLTEFKRSGTATGRSYGGTLGSGLGQLDWPYGIAAYQSDLIVADTFNNRVQRIHPAPGSVVWTVSGLGAPKAVTVSGSVVYVADTLNRRVLELNVANGKQQGSFGSTVLHTQVTGVAVEPNGDIWVVDSSFNRLVKFDANGNELLTFGKSGSAPGQFNQPAHIEVLSIGGSVQLLVVDTNNDRVQIFNTGD